MYRSRLPKKPKGQPAVVVTSTPISPVPDQPPATFSDDEVDENVKENKSVGKRKSSGNKVNRSTRSRLNLSTTSPAKSAKKRARMVSETEDLFGASFAASTIAAESPDKNTTTASKASTSKPKLTASRSTRSKQLIVDTPTKSQSGKTRSTESNPCNSNYGFIGVLDKCGFRLGEDDNPNFLGKAYFYFLTYYCCIILYWNPTFLFIPDNLYLVL